MLIELDQVKKTYQMGEVEIQALRGVSLTIDRGEFVAIMGASGSGKTTLMNLLGCLDRPSSGHYLLDGVEVSKMSDDQLARVRNQKIGFVFQSFNLLSRTTAIENVEMPLIYGPYVSRKKKNEIAKGLLERVGLGGRIHHHPSQLSGGEQQRVAIARSLVNHPSILFADEPTGNLDTKSSVEIMSIFEQLNAENITIVMVTHEADIAKYAKRTIMVKDGQIV
jgi:putative ABC transport system ATP-binding protein